VNDPTRKDDPDEQFVLDVLDSDEIDRAKLAPQGSPELVEELLRVRTIIQAFDSLGVAPAATPPPIPKWGPFVLREQVGRGRFGTVCRGFDPAVQRDVAVKLYSSSELPAEPRLMARVRHPNVVTVFGAAVHDGRPGIWMEFIHGHTLGHRVESEGPLPPDEVLRIGIGLCNALTAVHGAQLVHQDVKARNVMQEDSGRVVLMDFGAGLPSGDGDAPERLSGTPVYMAPEVVLGARPSVASDVYSLGVLLYYLLTGTYPVYAPDIDDLRRQHERHHRSGTRRFVATLRELRPEVSPALARVLARALAPSDHRYKTAVHLETALEAVRLGAWPRRRRRTALYAAAAAALLIGVVAGSGLSRAPVPPSVTLKRITRDDGLTLDPALSPDGKLLAYASDRSGEGSLDIWIQQMAGGEPLRLTKGPADDSQPCFSPDGSTIAFRSERAGGGLYLIPTLGGEPRLFAERGRWPRFSPDGRRIAYIVGPSIWIVSPDGGTPREIRTQGAVQSPPIWSPDGRHVLVLETEIRARTGGDVWDWWVVPVDSGAAVATGARALFRNDSEVYASGWPIPSSWVGDRVLFDAPHGDVRNLWEARIDGRSYHVLGPPRRLLASTESQLEPLLDPAGRLIFSTQVGVSYISELTLDAATARTHSRPHSVMPYYPPHGMHAVSADGRWLAFTSARLGNPAIWLRDVASGAERALTLESGDHNLPVLAADGRTLLYAVREGDALALYSLSTDGGRPRKVCDTCGPATDVSPDGRYILLQQGANEHATLQLLESGAPRPVEIFADRDLLVYRGHFSPDGRWVVFHTAGTLGGTQEFVAPFRGSQPVPRSEWIAVTDGQSLSDAPRWSPDGTFVYYISDRDGFRCIWAQRVDSSTRKPVGEPVAVQHLHTRQGAIANVMISAIDLSVARDRLFFNMGELKGSVWSAEFRSP
jgi:Tol biopolymer transport system component/serine/threonine protein kinase